MRKFFLVEFAKYPPPPPPKKKKKKKEEQKPKIQVKVL